MIEFHEWPKIARLFREIVITEKLDGTNAAIGIVDWQTEPLLAVPDFASCVLSKDGNPYVVYAQSRKRIISPVADNHGFARWVEDNTQALVATLGPGLHYGEWWGQGIQRGYGLTEKRFSLFNITRWQDACLHVPGLSVVPVLYRGDFSTVAVVGALEELRTGGSVAAPQYMRPEGVVVYHTAANTMFKATLEGDSEPKSLASRRELALAA